MSEIKDKKKNPRPARRNLLFKLRPVFRWIIRLRGAPKSIAGGVGLGTFLAFTPTMGVQVVLALFFATLLNLNRPAAVVPVWITNPVTMAPIYTFNYWVGCFFLDGPPVTVVSKKLISITAEMAQLDFFAIKEQIATFFHLGREIILPLVAGSLLVGIFAGIFMYVLSLKSLLFLQTRRQRKYKAR
ncbi:MAG: DUF2062 domain-containing protein [Gammaproteobacteria bacterium]|nr:DUF2062 domain-containing protein [Gammaproteobacteria bacterium]